MPHVTLGERVYVKDTDMFGDVTRTRVLGVEAISLVDDEGTTKAFFGKTLETGLVGKESSTDGTGATVEVPVDVREVGANVLTAMNVSPEDQRMRFVKFMGMFDQATRRAYMDDWVANKDNATQREAFLARLATDLEDDEAFIRVQGGMALSGVDPDVRQKMFGKLVTTLSKPDLEGVILEWMMVKNDPDKKEEFLQGMYELLMDDDDYIAMEGKKAFTRLRILADEQTELFTAFMTTVSAEERAEFTAEYRKVRRSKSKQKQLLENLVARTRRRMVEAASVADDLPVAVPVEDI